MGMRNVGRHGHAAGPDASDRHLNVDATYYYNYSKQIIYV